MQRPAPAPSAETRPFWEAAKRGVLALARCTDCGHIPYPPQPRCPACLSDAQSWVALSGRAMLRGWTEVHIAAVPGHSTPVTIAECALIEDPRAVLALLDETGSVQGCAPDAAVRISFATDANGWAYPQVSAVTPEAAQ